MQMFSSNIFTQGKSSILLPAFHIWFLPHYLSTSGARQWRTQSYIRGHPLGLHACVILLYELVKRLGGLFLETFLILRCLQ